MESLFLFGLTIIFLVESFYEVRLYMLLRVVAQHFPQLVDQRRLHRVLRIEQVWNWLSWLFLLVLIILPNGFSMLLISIITMIETIIVHEMDQIKQQIRK